MFGDNGRNISVNSQPSGADIYVDNIQYGTTPAIIPLSSYIYGGKVVTLKKQGYNTVSTVVNSQFNMVSLWNLLNGFGFLIDAATGDIMKLPPEGRSVNMTLSQGNNTGDATTAATTTTK